MFDVGFSELVVIGVVALVVLGPERLPKVARTAGHLFGRLQRYVATVKADINREMEMTDLAKVKQEVQDAARSFEQTVQQHAGSLESEARAVAQAAEKTIAEVPAVVPPSAAPTQAELLTAQELDMPVRHGPAAPPVPGPRQGALDFGIEPTRSRATHS
jgi:sec-independent protein translocase protein TatB